MDVSKEPGLIKDLLGSAKGDELLEIWEEIYINRPSYVPGRPVEDSVYYEGQRSVILAFKQMLAMKPPKIKEHIE